MTDKDILKDLHFRLASLGMENIKRATLMKEIQTNRDVLNFQGHRMSWEYGEPQKMVYEVAMMRPTDKPFYKLHTVLAAIPDVREGKQILNVDDPPFLRIRHIQNLLNGRPVMRQRVRPEASNLDNFWYKIDFKNKDETGNYRLNEFWPGLPDALDKLHATRLPARTSPVSGSLESPYFKPIIMSITRLCDMIQAYPLKENRTYEGTLRVLGNLMDGNAASVSPISKDAEHIGFMRVGGDLKSLELLIRQNGKLVQVDQELRQINNERVTRAKGRSL